MIKLVSNKIIAVIIAVFMVFTLIPSSIAYAADTEYDYQPPNAEADGKQSVKLLDPSDISVIEETSDYFLNQINTVVDGTQDIEFSLSMTSGINNFSKDNFLANNMPVIKIYDSDSNIAAEYSNGSGDLKFLGSEFGEGTNNQGGQMTKAVFIGVDEGVLGTGDYVLEFGKDFCGNNTSKKLGKNVRFNFTVNALAELEVLIVTAQNLLDSVQIGEEVGQYPQESAETFRQAITAAEHELELINSELSAGTITGEQAAARKVAAAEILDAAVGVFKASRIVSVEKIEIEGIKSTQYVGDTGFASAKVIAYPNEDSYKKVTWEASENINIDAVSGEWLAVYAGEGWVRAVSKTDGSVEGQIDVNVTCENGIASYVYGGGVSMSTALGENLTGVTSLKLFTTNGYEFTKDDVTGIQESFTALKTLDLKCVEVEFIGSNWFKDWETIETIVLPHDLKGIGLKAFYNCSGLKNIAFPATLEDIGASAFAGCTSLESTLEVLAANPPAFETELKSSLKIGDSFNGYGTDEAASITTVKVPFGSKETYLEDDAWSRFDIVELEEKNLTVGFTAPGNFAAAAESALAEKGWDDQEVSSLSINSPDDAYLEKVTDVKYLQNNFMGVTTLDLRGTQFNGTNLQSSTFEGRRNVREIKLPADITHIGKKVFYGCSNLRTLTIPEGVTYRDASNPGIGADALSGCDRLETLIFLPVEPPGYDGSMPASLTTVYVPNLSVLDYQDEYSSLRDVIIPNASVETADSAFVEAMGSAKLTASVDSKWDIGSDLKWEIATSQDADNPIAVINEKTGVITGCRYGTVTVKVTAGYGTASECSDTCTVTVSKAPAVTATAASSSYNSAKVSWSPMSGAKGYQVWRSTSKSGTYSLIETVSSGTLSYSDTGLNTGTTYYYKVRGYKTVDGVRVYSEYSAVKSAKPTLATPTASATRYSYNSNKIGWKAVSGASGYKIYRATSKSGKYTLIATKSSKYTSITDTGRTTGTTYYYKVRAYRMVNGSPVYSGYSTVKSATPSLSKVSSVKTAKAGTRKIKVSWKKTAGASGYVVYRSTKKSSGYKAVKTIKSGSTVKYTTGKLTKNKKYYFKVRAYRNVKVNGKTKKVYGPYSSVVYRTAK